MRSLFTVALLCCLGLACVAQPYSFSYKRLITGTDVEGWYGIKLPLDFFTHVNGSFSDMRIYEISNGDTTEIPYVIRTLERDTKEEVIALPVVNKSTKDGVLYLTFQLKDEGSVNSIDFEFKQTNYNAFVKIDGSHNQQEWFEVTQDKRILSIQHDDVDYKYAKVQFADVNYKFVRVGIRSDTPLDFVSALVKKTIGSKGSYDVVPAKWVSRNDGEHKQTIVDIQLGSLVPVTQVNVVAVFDEDYYRDVMLACVFDSVKTPKGWTKLYETLTRGYVTSIGHNEISFQRQFTNEIRLTIANHDNRPLKITGIEVLTPVTLVVAKLKPANTYLFYGNEGVESPTYDLIHFSDSIPDSLARCTLGSEHLLRGGKVVESESALFESKLWLWVVMGVAIVIIGFFTLQMMRER